MQFVQQQLAAVGVTLKIEPLEAGVLTAKMFNVQKPEDATIVMHYGGWSSSTGDADWGMRPMLYTKSFPPVLSNLAWYSNPATDAAIEEGLATVDPDEAGGGVCKGAGTGVEGCAVDLPGRRSQPGGVLEEAARRVHAAGSAVPPDRGRIAGLMRGGVRQGAAVICSCFVRAGCRASSCTVVRATRSLGHMSTNGELGLGPSCDSARRLVVIDRRGWRQGVLACFGSTRRPACMVGFHAGPIRSTSPSETLPTLICPDVAA